MQKFVLTALGAAVLSTAAGVAVAQSPDYMMEDCRYSAQVFYQEFEAGTEAKYEGQRTDGTHAVNGTIFLENRGAPFSCSYNRDGDTLVGFYAEDQDWPEFVKGNGSPYQSNAGGAGGSMGAGGTVDVGGVMVPQAAIDSCVSDAASAMSVAGQDIMVIKAGQEGADNFYIEVAHGSRHLVCSVNSKGEIFDTRYGKL